MPKVLHPYRQRAVLSRNHGNSSLESRSSAMHSMATTAPRKVSFEEGHQSLSSFGSSQNSFLLVSPKSCLSGGCPTAETSDRLTPSDPNNRLGLNNTTSSNKSGMSRSLLRRHSSSVCLVNLAGGGAPVLEDHEETNEALHISIFATECPGKVLKVNSPACPSSPWGHFVDILIPPDQEQAAGQASKAALHRSLGRSSQYGLTIDSDPELCFKKSLRPVHRAAPYNIMPRNQRSLQSSREGSSRKGMFLKTPTLLKSHKREGRSFIPEIMLGTLPHAAELSGRFLLDSRSILAQETSEVLQALTRLDV